MKQFVKRLFFLSTGLAVVFALLYCLGSLLWYGKLKFQRAYRSESIRRGFVRHPFLTSNHIPNQHLVTKSPQGEIDWKLNAQGCRDDRDYPVEKKASVIRWMFLGGSALVAGSTGENTIPSLVRREFSSRPEKPAMEFYNFGRVAWDSTIDLLAFATEFNQFKPDYLVIYDGRNDAFMASMPLYRPYWNAWSHEVNEELNADSDLEHVLYPIWRIRESLRSRGNPLKAKMKMAQNIFAEKQNGQIDFYQAHPEIGEVYRGNLQNIIHLASAMGCRGVCLLIQPELYWCPKSRSGAEESFDRDRVQPSWRKAMIELYPIIKEAHAAAAKSTPIPVIEADLNPLFAGPEQLFVDDCHGNDEGNRLASKAVVSQMERLLEITQPRANARPGHKEANKSEFRNPK